MNIMPAFKTFSTNLVLLLAVFMVISHVSCADPPALTRFQVGSKQNPAKSCKDIKAQGGTVTKNYYISLNGSLEQVYCDQITAGGGWTLVYSYTFTNFDDFGNGSNAVTPRPNWDGGVPLSTKTPTSEVDFNAMDFNLWWRLGREFLLKSNLNNWYACTEGTGEDGGSLVFGYGGSINCTLAKNFTGKCGDVVPDRFNQNLYSDDNEMGAGDLQFFNTHKNGNSERNMITLNMNTDDDEYPTHDPCGNDSDSPLVVPNPHGNIYIR